jgi:hypothetical protein
VAGVQLFDDLTRGISQFSNTILYHMQTTVKVFVVTVLLVITACTATKKSAIAAAPEPAAPIITSPAPKSADGIYAPGNAELNAIRIQYKEVSMNMLEEGYSIYTKGACVSCHAANGIYQYSETKWKLIIDDMAPRTSITAKEKDAVLKYVLSIKAAQAK